MARACRPTTRTSCSSASGARRAAASRAAAAPGSAWRSSPGSSTPMTAGCRRATRPTAGRRSSCACRRRRPPGAAARGARRAVSFPSGLRALSGCSHGAPTARADAGRMSQTAPLETPVPRPAPGRLTAGRDVDIVVPVYNEEAALEPGIRRLHRFLSESFPFGWRIVIADNASTDATPEVARRLRGVEYMGLERKGRGRALRAAWSRSDARVVAYMDVDLSTDLRALLPLVAPLLSGHSDVAIGSRLAHGARVVRGPKREVIS